MKRVQLGYWVSLLTSILPQLKVLVLFFGMFLETFTRKLFLLVLSILSVAFVTSSVCNAQTYNLDSLNNIAYEEYVSDYTKYASLFDEALKQSKQKSDTANILGFLKKLRVIEYLAGDIPKSIDLSMECIAIFQNRNDSLGLSEAYCDMGYAIKRQDLDKGIEYMQRGIKIQENYNDSALLLINYDNYGVLKEFKYELDSALFYYDKSLALKRVINDSNGIPFTYNKMAYAYMLKGQYAKAVAYMDSSNAIRSKTNNFYYLGDNAVFYGDIYKAWGKNDKALYHYKQAVDFGLKAQYPYIVRDAVKALSVIEEESKNYKAALTYFKEYKLLTDSLDGVSAQKNVNNLLLKYESVEKEKTIAEQKTLLVKEALRSRNRQLIALVCVFATLFILLYAIYRIRLARQKRLEEVKIEQLKLQNERIRVSRDLHDNIGAELTLIASSAELYRKKTQDKTLETELENIGANAKNAMQQLRETIWAISPKAIDLDNFSLKLKNYANKILSASSIKLSFNVEVPNGSLELGPAITINLYRICQEIINNACKHSKAKDFTIEICHLQNELKIVLKDNGVGFNENDVESGYGLQNMKGRVEDVGASLSFNSKVGSGTSYILALKTQ